MTKNEDIAVAAHGNLKLESLDKVTKNENNVCPLLQGPRDQIETIYNLGRAFRRFYRGSEDLRLSRIV